MNLIQRWTTASRANREKSVNNTIAQRIVQPSYGSNGEGSELSAAAVRTVVIPNESGGSDGAVEKPAFPRVAHQVGVGKREEMGHNPRRGGRMG